MDWQCLRQIGGNVASGTTQFVKRVIRYGIVGLVVAILYSLAIVLLVAQFHMRDATAASALAFVVVQPLAFFAHRHVTFFDAARDSFQPLRFAVTTTSTFLVAIGGMYMVTELLGRSYLLGIALNWALIPAVNFLIYLVWVFRLGRPQGGAVPLLPSADTGGFMERS